MHGTCNIWSTYIFRTWYWWNQSFTCMRDGSFFSPSHCYTGGPSNESFRRSAKDNRFLLPKWIKPCWWVVSWIWSGIHQCTSKNGANMHTTDLIPWPITWHSLPKIGHIYMHICIFDPWSCEGILSSIWIFIFNKEWWDLWGHTAVNIYGKNPKDHIQQPVRCKIQYMSKQEKPFNQINKGYIPFTKRINEVNGWFFFHPGCLECDHCFQIDTIAMLVLCKFSIMAAHVLVFLQRRCDRGLQGLLVLVQLLADWIRPVLHQFLLQFCSLGKRIGVDMVFKD